MPRRPLRIAYSVLFALSAALLTFQPLTTRTFLLLFYPEGGGTIQPLIDEVLPIPRGLAWSDFTFHLIEKLGQLPGPAVLGLEIGLYALLVYGLLQILNPTFRLTTGVDWDKQILHKTYIHTTPLIKAFLIAVSAFFPAFLLWHLIAFLLGSSVWSLGLRMALMGALVWMLFSRNGVAADYESGNYEFPRDRRVQVSILARGAIAGIIVTVMMRFAPFLTSDTPFFFFRALGGIGEGHWWRIVAITVGCAVGLGLSGVGLALALGAPGLSRHDRMRASVLPMSLLAITLLLGRVVLPDRMRNRYDYDPYALSLPAHRLARKAGVRMGPSGIQTLFLLAPGRTRPANVAIQSIEGLDASREAARKIEAFLKERHYTTALSAPAFKTLFDAAALQWDTLETLRVCFMNLTRCPDFVYLPIFLEQLDHCAATPEALRYVDRLADSRFFVHPDPDSLTIIGHIYARFGQRARAEQWYRRAKVPETRIPEMLAQRTMMHEGEVKGQVLVNGAPRPGVRVGVALTGALERLNEMLLRPNLLRPFWLRWISASTTTDASGRFTLRNLVAGRYFLVVSVPGVAVPPRLFAQTSVQNNPGTMFVAFGKPKWDVGTISLTIPRRPPPLITPGATRDSS